MKKTITAIGNESIHNEYKRSGEYEVIGKDIQYQEGILEVFEEPNEIDLLIMSDFLPGYFSMRELIKKIKRKKKELTIFILCQKATNEIQMLLEEKWVDKIIPLKEEEEIETNSHETDELKKEIERLKRENKKLKKEKVKYGKVVLVVGEHNVGKTSIAFMLSQMANLSRILLIDFDDSYYGLLKITGLERNEEFKKHFNAKTDICKRTRYH